LKQPDRIDVLGSRISVCDSDEALALLEERLGGHEQHVRVARGARFVRAIPQPYEFHGIKRRSRDWS
jgi:hypothetical protein